LDNEEAEILVGREVPFQTGSFTSGNNTATNPFNTIERKNVGLKLKVKPQINEGNEIYLEIDQEVSDVLPKGEAVDLQTTKRQIKTRVIVGDGKVVVLGGLINEKETQTESKVPFLGDLPWVGGLFRSTTTTREKVNLMVFLRPVIIRNNETSDYYSQKKYSYMKEEQTHLLEKKSSGLLSGDDLRPRLPTLQEWKGTSPAMGKPPVMNAPPLSVNKANPIVPLQSPNDKMVVSAPMDELLSL
ncbi:MAG: type II secretion system protein GspD, partial [Thiomicrorhabdus sp.]|nr:type II secretion system protein GspD [Thiomicrorhabdus sp.]